MRPAFQAGRRITHSTRQQVTHHEPNALWPINLHMRVQSIVPNS